MAFPPLSPGAGHRGRFTHSANFHDEIISPSMTSACLGYTRHCPRLHAAFGSVKYWWSCGGAGSARDGSFYHRDDSFAGIGRRMAEWSGRLRDSGRELPSRTLCLSRRRDKTLEPSLPRTHKGNNTHLPPREGVSPSTRLPTDFPGSKCRGQLFDPWALRSAKGLRHGRRPGESLGHAFAHLLTGGCPVEGISH